MESLARNERRFLVVFDMSGWRLSHGLQLRKVHALVRTLQDHYPEMLEAAILLKVNRFFASAWRLIKPLLDPVTAAKVQPSPSPLPRPQHYEPQPLRLHLGTSRPSPRKVNFVPANNEVETMVRCGVPLSIMPSMYGGDVDGDAVPIPNLPGEPNVPMGGAAPTVVAEPVDVS